MILLVPSTDGAEETRKITGHCNKQNSSPDNAEWIHVDRIERDLISKVPTTELNERRKHFPFSTDPQICRIYYGLNAWSANDAHRQDNDSDATICVV